MHKSYGEIRKKIKRLLIANRGEPVMRAIRTCKELGIESAVVYYEVDAFSDWVFTADFAFELERTDADVDSPYLDGKQIIEIARSRNCNAIWPGWGFLSENAEFAEQVAAAGLIWVGPPPKAMRELGGKSESHSAAVRAGFDTIEQILVTDSDNLDRIKGLGFPLVIKPVYGGGGQGQKIVTEDDDLTTAINDSIRQAQTLFVDGSLIVQKYLQKAKHIELQMIGDTFGNVCVLGTRDCSIQRRNQKIIEEGPAPNIDLEALKRPSEAAVNLFRDSGYFSAGTIETLYCDGKFYFLEVNARLQVEHPVTEESTIICGEGHSGRPDMLAEMLSIAAGNPLTFTQEMVSTDRCAIEARLYAEDPDKGFQPTPGSIYLIRYPRGSDVRVDSGIVGHAGEILKDFDPMFAKIVTWDVDRNRAIRKLHRYLRDTIILGIHTNIDYLRRITAHPNFLSGDYVTRFIADSGRELAPSLGKKHFASTIASTLGYIDAHKQAYAELKGSSAHYIDMAMNILPEGSISYILKLGDDNYSCIVNEWNDSRFFVTSGDNCTLLDVSQIDPNVYSVRDSTGRIYEVFAFTEANEIQMMLDGEQYIFGIAREGAKDEIKDPHATPYGGRIVRLCVKAGDPVKAGDDLYVIESMKMETIIRASFNGIVENTCFSAGHAVEAGDVIMRIVPLEKIEEKKAKIDYVAPPDDQDPLLGSIFLSKNSNSLISEEHNELYNKYRYILTQLPLLYFIGYNITAAAAMTSFEITARTAPEKAVSIIKDVVHAMIAIWRLSDDDMSDYLIDYIRRHALPDNQKYFGNLLSEVLSCYGDPNTRNFEEADKHMPRILLGMRRSGPKQLEMIIDMIDHSIANCSDKAELAKATASLISSGILDQEEVLKHDATMILSELHSLEYYKTVQPPVAMDYLSEYEDFQITPLAGLTPEDIGKMRYCVEKDSECKPSDSGFELPDWLKSFFCRWFEGFGVRELYVNPRAEKFGIKIFELCNSSDAKDKRLAVIGLLKTDDIVVDGEGSAAAIEKIILEAHRCISQYDLLGDDYKINHVFSVFPPEIMCKWESGRGGFRINSSIIKDCSARIAGFISGTRVFANELLLNLEIGGNSFYHIIEIQRVTSGRIVIRPPYPISERVPELAKQEVAYLNEKQHMRGKLLNVDRAKLLFDGGNYEELFFPEVDGGGTPIGLNVYRGNINGTPALAYAGDFRIRGGALGTREGKKLAATVVLAYVWGVTLIGIHDGAGADIKDSVASLGWAGAYFGAIANTGGFSNPGKFWEWYDEHLERKYFDTVLRHFNVRPHRHEKLDGDWSQAGSRFLHLHLNIGASVGMLVYGAAISAMSIMSVHPEVYRVLTGAQTVEKVLGERATNYELGGARTHARYSGDIDVDCPSEEDAIRKARLFAKFVMTNRDRHAKHWSRGGDKALFSKCTAYSRSAHRSKIICTFDEGSFIETRNKLKGASQLMTGYASIKGSPFGIAAQLSKYGIRNPRTLKKLLLLFAGCQEFGLPLVMITVESWYGIPPKSPPKTMYLRSECDLMFSSISVPRISIAIGPRSLDKFVHQNSDLFFYVVDGTETPFDLTKVDIMSHLQFQDLESCMETVAFLLPYLTKKEVHAPGASHHSPVRLPESMDTPYDMREVLPHIFDEGSFIELQGKDALPLVTGFARAGGHAVGIIADNPIIAGGAQTAFSLGKFTRFNRICEKFNIPLIEFNDSPAFQPGSKQEQMGIQGEGGKSLREECLGRIPRLSVTLRQNYGGRFIHANLKTLGPNRAALACEGSRIGVMGAGGAISVLHGRKLSSLSADEKKAEEVRLKDTYIRDYLSPEKALQLGYIDKIIPLDRLMTEIHKWRSDVINLLKK